MDGLTAEAFDHGLVSGDLVAVYAMRGAVHVVPGNDAAAFVAGCLPADETDAQRTLGDTADLLEKSGTTALDAVATIAAELAGLLGDGEPVAKGDLSAELHGRVPQRWQPWCPPCEAHHVPDDLFRLALMAAGHRVVSTRPATFAAAPQPPIAGPERRRAAEQLADRFLHSFGPARPEHFAAWRGFETSAEWPFGDVDALVEVQVGGDGRSSWLRAEDEPLMADPPGHEGVTMLPRDDAYLSQRDRHVLAPEADLRRRLWTSMGTTAAIVIDGDLAALWRGRNRRRRLAVTIEPLRRLARAEVSQIEAEAQAYAPFRGTDVATVEVVEQ